jgi:hypothetical protein
MKTSNRKLILIAGAAALLPLCAAPSFASPIVNTAGFSLTSLPANDDGSSGLVSLGFTANFYGVNQTQTYVNNNGNITFGAPQSTYTPYGLTSTLPGGITGIIAPFFADVDTRGSGSGLTTYGTGTYGGNSAFVVNWLNVGYYAGGTDKLDSFQLLLVDESSTGAGNFNIYFNYGSMQWDTGGASGGVDGLCGPYGQSAAAGYSNGSGNPGTNHEITGSHVCGAFINGGPDALDMATNDGMPGQFLFEVRNGSVAPPPSVPEPATLALFGFGLSSLAFLRRRRRG